MAKKISNKLVALSSALILSVYAAGYTHTQNAADLLNGAQASAAIVQQATATPTSGIVVPSTGGSTATQTPTAQVVIPATPTATSSAATVVVPTATPQAAQASGYKDGTYSGTGTSRFGNISVSVTVANGKISAVTITRSTTSYPVSRISQLPSEVVAQQSANVDLVSGATFSSMAFRTAVQQALQQAQAA